MHCRTLNINISMLSWKVGHHRRIVTCSLGATIDITSEPEVGLTWMCLKGMANVISPTRAAESTPLAAEKTLARAPVHSRDVLRQLHEAHATHTHVRFLQGSLFLSRRQKTLPTYRKMMEEDLKLDTMSVDEVCEWLGANGFGQGIQDCFKGNRLRFH